MQVDSPQHAYLRLMKEQYSVLYEYFLLKNQKHERPKDVWQNLECVIQNGVIKLAIKCFLTGLL